MGRKIFKAGTMLSPLPPAMVTCGTMNEPNIITIAWTGIINSDPPMTYISVRPERYSYNIIKQSGEYVINLPTSSMVRTCDYCGMVSGSKVNKFEKTGLTPVMSCNVMPPTIEQCPIAIECKVKKIDNLGTHDMFISDIVGVTVDDKYIDFKGKFHLEKCSLLAYAHGDYYALGRRLGKFGISVAKRRPPQKK